LLSLPLYIFGQTVWRFKLRFHCAWLVLLFVLAGNSFAAPKGAPVVFASVKTAQISNELQLTGSVTSPRVASLSVSTAGLIHSLVVEEGSEVTVGDVLLSLDGELARLSARRAAADVDQINLELADTRRRLDEAKSLRKVKSIAESAIKSLEAEVAAKQAAAASARADAAYQLAVVARHTLKAPFSGVVASKLAEQGEWVNPGDPVLRLVSLSPLRLDFSIPEAYVGQIAAGTPIRVQSNAYPHRSYTAKVLVAVPVGQAGSRTFLLRAILNTESPGGGGLKPLHPGMSVRAWLLLAQGREGLLVPRDAVLRLPDGGSIVWVKAAGDEGLIVEERRVMLGLAAQGEIEIVEGLVAGDSVVVVGNEALQPGQAVYEVGR
jgi:RND family efflux transporter MFP subunit